MNQVRVYGADWCEDTHATLGDLKRLGVPFEYIDIERDPMSRAWVVQQNNGKQRTPTVDIAGTILVEPNAGELEQALRDKGVMS